MKASIIIPAYNEEGYIAAALDALGAQKFSDFEVIVVNNGSRDATASVVKTHPTKPLLIEEPRQGTMWACEAGRKIAQGTIIVRTDADCEPGTDWLMKGLRHFDDPRVVAVTGIPDFFDAPIFTRYLSLFIQIVFYPPVNLLMRWLDIGGILSFGTTFMRADVLESAGGFNTTFTFYGDDVDAAKRLARFGRIVVDPFLIVRTSGRRFNEEGTLMVGWNYLKHFLRITFLPQK